MIDKAGGSMKWVNLVLSRTSSAFLDLWKRSDKALIRMSIIENISGFLIVYPITFSASVAVSLILGWVSLKHADKVGII